MTSRSAARPDAGSGKQPTVCDLRLYVAGTGYRSQRAVQNLKRVCEEKLAGRYSLEIIDIYQSPARTRDEQIVAAPTLVRSLPKPRRLFVGDMVTEADIWAKLSASLGPEV